MFTVEEEVSVEDFRKIDVKHVCEIEYWSKTLCISEAELLYAVMHAGRYVGDVKKFLRKGNVPVQ